ncbi:MAG: response regulator [Bdellovibrio sp.]|nr:response regulator [Bdellovibrio sp.]
MIHRSRFFLFSSTFIFGFFLILGIIGYKVNLEDTERETRERLIQIRNYKETEIQTEIKILSNSLLDSSEKFLVKEFAQKSIQDELQINQWLKTQGGELKWKSAVYQEHKRTEANEINRIIGQMSPFASFLQGYYLQNQKNRKALAGKLSYFQHHDKIHTNLRNLLTRLRLDDILIVDAKGTVFYTVKKDILLGANLNFGFFSGSPVSTLYKWSQTAPPESLRFLEVFDSNLFAHSSTALLATPIFEDSNHIGTIIFQIPGSRIDEILSHNQDWRGLGLLDKGEVVAFGPEGLMRNNSRQYLQSLSRQTENPSFNAPTAPSVVLSKKDLQEFQDNEDAYLKITDYANQEVFASIGKIHLPGNVTWILMAKMNASEVVALANSRILPIAIFCLCLFLISLGVAYFIAIRFSLPLQLFNAEVDNVLEQRPARGLPPQNGEFRELGENLGILIRKVQQTHSEMLFWKRTVEVASEAIFLIAPLNYRDAAYQGLQIFDLNDAAANLLALSAHALKNSDLRMWVEADYDQIVGKLRNKPLEAMKLEGVLQRPSGQKIPIEMTWQPLWPEDTNSLFVMVAQETQERKESLNKIHWLENILSESQALSKTGSFRWDIKVGHLDCTKEKLRILGLDSKDSYPSYETFRALILVEDLPVFEKELHDSIKNITPFYAEYRIQKNDSGETVWLRTLGRIEYDNYGNAVCIYGVTQDITQERRQEKALISAKNDALRSSQAKSEFLARMSHEIRTPMNAIMGMAELLKETKLSDDQKYYTTIFCKAGEVLMSLINDILDVSKIEAGEVSIENIPFDLNILMSDVEQIMGPKAAEKGLAFSYEIAPGISPFLMGDPNKLRQILINLVSNSLKFTASGFIRVSVIKNPSKKDSLLITVTDTGVGIPASKQHLIFQKFSQADSSVARKYGGTGLGLAISKSLVELMGGQIWFTSRENMGTTFFLSVPYREQIHFSNLPKILENAENEVKLIGPKNRSADKKIRILIADDTEDNRTLFTHYLKNGPYEIIEAENGLEAVDKIKSGQFDIVFMDVQMPEMDGYTATGQIRTWEHDTHKEHLPIIALTAHALSEDRQKSLRAGCDDHVAKPFKKETLLGVINRYSL